MVIYYKINNKNTNLKKHLKNYLVINLEIL